MYVPQSFNESRPEVLHQLIMQNPLGVLVSHGEGGLDANHLPFHFKPQEGTQGCCMLTYRGPTRCGANSRMAMKCW